MDPLVVVHVIAAVALLVLAGVVGGWGLVRARAIASNAAPRESRIFGHLLQLSHTVVLATGLIGLALLALVESGLSRDDAYRLVQRNALRAWDEGLDLRELLEQDLDVKLPPEALDAAFDLDDALKHGDVVFDRLSALMTRKEEPVHA